MGEKREVYFLQNECNKYFTSCIFIHHKNCGVTYITKVGTDVALNDVTIGNGSLYNSDSSMRSFDWLIL